MQDGRDELRPLTVDVAARQSAGVEEQLRNGAPDLAFEMEHAMQDVVAQ